MDDQNYILNSFVIMSKIGLIGAFGGVLRKMARKDKKLVKFLF